MRFSAPLVVLLLAPGLGHAEDLQRLLKDCRGAACTKLGKRIVKGEFIKLTSEGTVTPQTRALLKDLFKRACAEGDGEGCWEWGAAASAPEEETQAFDKGCALQYEPACLEFGLRLSNGEGVAEDGARAAQLLEPLCKRHEPTACAQLGVILLTGRGVKQDIPRAFKLMEQACKGGEEIACENLEKMRRRLEKER